MKYLAAFCLINGVISKEEKEDDKYKIPKCDVESFYINVYSDASCNHID